MKSFPVLFALASLSLATSPRAQSNAIESPPSADVGEPVGNQLPERAQPPAGAMRAFRSIFNRDRSKHAGLDYRQQGRWTQPGQRP